MTYHLTASQELETTMENANRGMSFKVYDMNGWHIAWFNDIDHALKSMLANPTHAYHRIN